MSQLKKSDSVSRGLRMRQPRLDGLSTKCPVALVLYHQDGWMDSVRSYHLPKKCDVTLK